MKDNFKSRFSKERVAKFFDKEGFYIVLFVCVCIVAITAVWVSRTGLKNKENQSLEEPQEQTATNTPSQQAAVNNDEKVNIAESNNANSSKSDNQNTATDKTAAANSKANTPVKTAAPPVIKLDSPIKDGIAAENIIRDYSPEDMVVFEYPFNEWRAHLGIDIKGAQGTEVLAASDGKVIDVRNDNDAEGGLGWLVVVDHGNGYRTVYSNLAENLSVTKDSTVKKGQRIGIIGSTSIFEADKAVEGSADSHLHFEVLRKNDAQVYENVDPKQYLTMQN